MRYSSQPANEIPKWSRAILWCALSFSPALALGQSAPGPAGPPTTVAGDAQVEASYRDQLLRAQELARAGRRSEALALFQAAYVLKQEPGLLLEIARLQHGLGLGAEAIEHYRRYLIADPAAPAAFRDEAAQAIAQISALLSGSPPVVRPHGTAPTTNLSTPLPPGSPPPAVGLNEPVVMRRGHHNGMIAAGWSLLSIGYAAAFATGLSMGLLWGGDCYSSGAYGCSNPSSAAGWTLLIPVAGPVISSIVAPATSRQAVTYGLVWDLPWLLTDLPMQLVGLGLIIQGYKTPQHYLSRKQLSQIMVRPYSNPGGAGLVASGRF